MNIKTLVRTAALWLAALAFGLAIAGPASSAALSISQSPLFITISMPANIVVLLDDSGSLQWAHVPDWLAQGSTGTIQILGTVKVSGSHSSYTYSCSSGYTLNGSSTGSSSTPPSTTYCAKWQTFTATISVPSDSGTGGVYAPDTNKYKCACYNPLAYDPNQTYLPGYSPSGTLLTTSFTAAYVNPYVTSLGTVDLATSYEATVDYNPTTSATTLMVTDASNHDAFNNVSDEVNSCNGLFTNGSGTPSCQSIHNPQNAFYYVYNASNTGCGTAPASGASVTDERCLTKIVVSATSGPGNTDERQNFANWFSFYRTRNLTVNTGANRAFTSLGGNFRVAWRDLNTMSSSSTPFKSGGIKDDAGNSFDNRIGVFAGQHRTDFFTWLQRYGANNGTALRTALDTIGTYYQTPAGVNSPFAFDPAVGSDTGTDSPEYVCRPNYAVVMTDGLWNDNSIPSSPAIGNNDNTAITLPDNTAFAAGTHPYSDSNSQSLADIAFYYWSHSLRSDLGTSSSLEFMPYTKNVTVVDSSNKTASVIPYWNPANDPASWPHMVTFTVGLGMTSTITNPAWGGDTYSGGYAGLVTGTTAWPAVSSNSSNNVYDLWHAAIDSRGQFFSVDTPQDVAGAFNSIVNRIQGRVGSSSAIAVNSTRLDSDTFIYQAQFNSGGWTGEVLAFPISPTNGSIGAQAWAASSLIPAAASRSIFTWDETANSNAGGAISFLWANLNSAEQAFLNKNMAGSSDGNGSLRVNYLRGDQSQEQTQGGNFRNRSSILGDIVNSNPEFVGKQDFGSSAIPGAEGLSYPAFVASKASRTPMLYVGANDGMMHGFNANTGVEVFDYVPRGIYPRLSALTDPNYTHQYYVDGSETAVDAYISGAWKTLVVGTTGAGGKEVFLLDVTSPNSFSASNVMWDYDATLNSDADLGYTLGQGTIVRLHDGDWYVAFGNGYNSTNQHAVLYLYNIRTNTIRKFDTLVGSVALPNGMSAPTAVDYDGDRVTDAIYAGDLQGNVWKIDLSSSDNTKWGFTFTSSGSPAPLFTAKDSNGNTQPITDRLQVGLSKTGNVMVFFGTGTYFLTGDNAVGSNPPVMSFYGLIDDLGSASTDQVSRSNLLQQFVVASTTVLNNNVRVTTAYAMTTGQQGWYINLLTPPLPGTAQGERVVSDPVLKDGQIIFTTLIPQGNACQFGGISWLLQLDSTTGAALTQSPFDLNGDGSVNKSDFVTVTYTDPVSGKTVTTTTAVSGLQSNVGIIKTPGIIEAGTKSYMFVSGSTGGMEGITGNNPDPDSRLSWQQLQ